MPGAFRRVQRFRIVRRRPASLRRGRGGIHNTPELTLAGSDGDPRTHNTIKRAKRKVDEIARSLAADHHRPKLSDLLDSAGKVRRIV